MIMTQGYSQDEVLNRFEVHLLENKHGVKISVTNFGGRIISIFTPDKHGNFKDIVLGYDHVEQYLGGNPYFGSIIGRFGNRIALGKFSLEGQEYHLNINNRSNSLHGGPGGFNNRFWNIRPLQPEGVNGLELTYTSQDGEEGYPGNL